MLVTEIKIGDNYIIKLKKLETDGNYNKWVTLLTNNVIVYGYVTKESTSDETIKEDVLKWINRDKSDNLLQSILNKNY